MISERQNTLSVSKFITKAFRLKNNFKRRLPKDSRFIDTGKKPDENKPISTRQLDRNYYVIQVLQRNTESHFCVTYICCSVENQKADCNEMPMPETPRTNYKLPLLRLNLLY